jgi:hypothetical protein
MQIFPHTEAPPANVVLAEGVLAIVSSQFTRPTAE